MGATYFKGKSLCCIKISWWLVVGGEGALQEGFPTQATGGALRGSEERASPRRSWLLVVKRVLRKGNPPSTGEPEGLVVGR
ncbi:MAG: hypothetical protein ACHBN1_27805 [Heteroscytonema crispum UTEX LB 1556]